MSRKHIALAVAAIALAVSQPAAACSVVDDYRVPTNLELVEAADLIMLGRVIGESGDDGPLHMRGVLVEPIVAIRGTLPTEVFTIPMTSLGASVGRWRVGGISNPFELEYAHGGSGMGSCIRSHFELNTRVLFFLNDADGTWRAGGGPYSRWAEDVLTDDAPWLELVRLYAAVADAPEEERAAMLEAERARYAAQESDPVATLMASDIARQMQGPNATFGEMFGDAADAEEGEPAENAFEDDEYSEEYDEVTGTVGEDDYSLTGSIDLSGGDSAANEDEED